jgi:hypothetical protein
LTSNWSVPDSECTCERLSNLIRERLQIEWCEGCWLFAVSASENLTHATWDARSPVYYVEAKAQSRNRGISDLRECRQKRYCSL